MYIVETNRRSISKEEIYLSDGDYDSFLVSYHCWQTKPDWSPNAENDICQRKNDLQNTPIFTKRKRQRK
jgi:hypothetical protein